MTLCGLALAGANLKANHFGRIRGRITGDELAQLDLLGCELAVLSACDSSRGVRSSGSAVASLQLALHAAGARTTVTALWKVSDAATSELMGHFYRALWLEGKPKAEALWQAKMQLRQARDASGDARWPVRDWAAWVLSGEG